MKRNTAAGDFTRVRQIRCCLVRGTGATETGATGMMPWEAIEIVVRELPVIEANITLMITMGGHREVIAIGCYSVLCFSQESPLEHRINQWSHHNLDHINPIIQCRLSINVFICYHVFRYFFLLLSSLRSLVPRCFGPTQPAACSILTPRPRPRSNSGRREEE